MLKVDRAMNGLESRDELYVDVRDDRLVNLTFLRRAVRIVTGEAAEGEQTINIVLLAVDGIENS